MANFSAPILQATTATTYKTSAAIWTPASSRRAMLYEVEMGQSGGLSSTDCQVQWDLSRFSATAILTATTVAFNSNDEGDSAVAVVLFANNATAEPTYTTAGLGLNLKNWGINQRGSYRWRALDDGDQLMLAATAQKGFGLRGLSSNFTGSLVGNLSIVER